MPQAFTKYFGSTEYQEGDAVQFPGGLPGFVNETQFLVITPAATAPLHFLQSLRRSDLCFLALPILSIDPNYDLAVAAEDLRSLGLEPGCFAGVRRGGLRSPLIPPRAHPRTNETK